MFLIFVFFSFFFYSQQIILNLYKDPNIKKNKIKMEYYVVNNTSTISFTGLFNILRNIFLNQTTFLNSAWVLILLPHVTARP